MPVTQPLIITLAIDKPAHAYFTKLRNEHFPAWCNYLDAHITLFHRLPADVALIRTVVEKFSKRKPFTLGITGIKNMGQGVAFVIQSEEFKWLHTGMQKEFAAYLTAQDRKKRWPHITIQNKVTAYKAQQTAEKLTALFTPFSIEATGFSIFQYNKGPWLPLEDFLFES